MGDLRNKIALVTGATQGLGKGIALALAAQGAEVIINYPPFEKESDNVVSDIINAGGKAVKIMADVSQAEQVEAMFAEIKSKYNRLDILINNAGTSQAKDIFEIDYQDWHRIIDTNLSSGFYCSKKAMEMMRGQKYGRIIFISSVVGQQGALFGHVHYAASKSGQSGMMKTLARTGAGMGITVNAIAPGVIETDLLIKTHGMKGVKKIAETVPLGLGSAQDIGYAAAFLCSDKARYITGITLDVNGGMYLR